MQGKRVGVYMDLAMRPKSDPDVQALFMKAIEDMEAAGAEIVMNVSMKVLPWIVSAISSQSSLGSDQVMSMPALHLLASGHGASLCLATGSQAHAWHTWWSGWALTSWLLPAPSLMMLHCNGIKA